MLNMKFSLFNCFKFVLMVFGFAIVTNIAAADVCFLPVGGCDTAMYKLPQQNVEEEKEKQTCDTTEGFYETQEECEKNLPENSAYDGCSLNNSTNCWFCDACSYHPVKYERYCTIEDDSFDFAEMACVVGESSVEVSLRCTIKTTLRSLNNGKTKSETKTVADKVDAKLTVSELDHIKGRLKMSVTATYAGVSTYSSNGWSNSYRETEPITHFCAK